MVFKKKEEKTLYNITLTPVSSGEKEGHEIECDINNRTPLTDLTVAQALVINMSEHICKSQDLKFYEAVDITLEAMRGNITENRLNGFGVSDEKTHL